MDFPKQCVGASCYGLHVLALSSHSWAYRAVITRDNAMIHLDAVRGWWCAARRDGAVPDMFGALLRC